MTSRKPRQQRLDFPPHFNDRDQKIVEMRRAGMMTEAIAKATGLTRGRITQICKKAGIQRFAAGDPRFMAQDARYRK